MNEVGRAVRDKHILQIISRKGASAIDHAPARARKPALGQPIRRLRQKLPLALCPFIGLPRRSRTKAGRNQLRSGAWSGLKYWRRWTHHVDQRRRFHKERIARDISRLIHWLPQL